MQRQNQWIVWVALVLVFLPASWVLFSGRLIQAPDVLGALIRVAGILQYFGDGQALPRWFPDMNSGYGYPMLNFYPPLFSFLIIPFYKITNQLVLSFNAVTIAVWFLSGAGMYWLAKGFWGRAGGFISAVAYLYAPYHVCDFYGRGAYAEFTAMTAFPFIVLALVKISRGGGWGWVGIGAVWIGFLTMTHNVMSMFFLPVVCAYLLFITLTQKDRRVFLLGLSALAIGLMLSAFFWVPAFGEKVYLNLHYLSSMRYDVGKNFLSFSQLIFPPGMMGVEGFDGMSFLIGAVHLLLALLPVIFWKRTMKWAPISRGTFLFFLGILLVTAFMTLPWSQFIWENVTVLKFSQYPWRILAVGAFAVSLIAGSAVLIVQERLLYRRIFTAVAAGLIVLTALPLCSPPKGFYKGSPEAVLTGLANFYFLGEGEYTPKWIKVPPTLRPAQKFEVVLGEGRLSAERAVNPVLWTSDIQASRESMVCFYSFYFPGWRAFVDGREVNILPDNPYGLILFAVPPGEHSLRVVFGSTPLRIAGFWISIVGALLLFVIVLGCLYSRKNRRNPGG